jgi:hypothetical protein
MNLLEILLQHLHFHLESPECRYFQESQFLPPQLMVELHEDLGDYLEANSSRFSLASFAVI